MAKRNSARVMKTLCKLGTVAHNRQFTPRDLYEYGGSRAALTYLRRNGFVTGKNKLFPTKKGWRAVELACALTKESR